MHAAAPGNHCEEMDCIMQATASCMLQCSEGTEPAMRVLLPLCPQRMLRSRVTCVLICALSAEAPGMLVKVPGASLLASLACAARNLAGCKRSVTACVGMTAALQEGCGHAVSGRSVALCGHKAQQPSRMQPVRTC